MFTVVESSLFSRLWPDYWSESEHDEFLIFIAMNPAAGDVIVGTGGCRKVRWQRPGSGKRGGVRVIYLMRDRCGDVHLLTIYPKNERKTLPAAVIRKIAQELEP